MSRVIGYLKESKVGEALVDDGDASTCIVSIGDLLNMASLNTKIAKVMHQVPRLGPNNTVGDAATLMHEHRARSMPVYKQKRLIGQITSLRVVAKLLESETPGRISSIMTPSPFCIDSSDSIAKARETMLKRKIDQLPVTKKGALYGVITSDEIVFNMMPKAERKNTADTLGNRYDEPLGNFDLSDVISNDITDSLRDVSRTCEERIELLCHHGHGRDPGIVTYRDFLTVLARKATEQLDTHVHRRASPTTPSRRRRRGRSSSAPSSSFAGACPTSRRRGLLSRWARPSPPRRSTRSRSSSSTPGTTTRTASARIELADAFDEVNNWVKELVQRSRPRKQKRTSNARSYPDDFRPETAPG